MKQHEARATAAIIIATLFGVGFVSNAAGAPQAPAQPPDQQQSPQPVPAASGSPNDLFVTVGKSVLVNSARPIERVSVGFGDIAEATAVGPREILVNGKAPGETSMIIWQQGGGKLFLDVTVQPSHFSNDTRSEILRRQMSVELPGQKIETSVENDLIFLRGTAKDLTSAQRAIAIASSMGKPVNLLYVDVPPAEAQILLKVKFASVDRTMLTELGVNIFSTGATNTIGAISTQQFSPLTLGNSGASGTGSITGRNGVTATVSNLLNLFFFRPDLDLGATIRALQTKGVVEVLAEPNVLAENGKQASFLAGGEFPYPVVQGGNVGGSTAVTVQFRQFGVRLNFLPTVTPRGTIRLQVAPEVSSLDYANGVSIGGFTVPGIDVRNVNTEVELGEGQSFAIGGLLDNRETETFSKIPFLGDIPVLGKFFQSKSKNRTNTELMVIVTPELVHPMPAGKQIAGPNFPVPFLPPNSTTPMSTPGKEVTGPIAAAAPNAPIPMESLVKSLVEKPMTVTSTSGAFGQAQPTPATTTPVPPSGVPQQPQP